MKNKYVGDVGDYGKYGLLRFLAKKGIKIGVNWYLTDKDNTNDGEIRDYLKNKSGIENLYDEKVFSLLNSLPERDIKYIEQSNIIPNAVFFNEELNTTKCSDYKKRRNIRNEWNKKALADLSDSNLIFADPDNGFCPNCKTSRKNGEKYISVSEIQNYYNKEKDIVFYCHKGRIKQEAWDKKIKDLADSLPGSKTIVLAFHRGTQRFYVFLMHPERYEYYNDIIDEFMKTNWGTLTVNGKQPPFTKYDIMSIV